MIERLLPLTEDTIGRVLVLVSHESCGLRVHPRLLEKALELRGSHNELVEFAVTDPGLEAGEWRMDLASEPPRQEPPS